MSYLSSGSDPFVEVEDYKEASFPFSGDKFGNRLRDVSPFSRFFVSRADIETPRGVQAV